jgi:hypothetical protein
MRHVMKKLILLFIVLSFFSTLFIYSQPASQIVNDNIPFINGSTGDIGAQCVGGLIYDDNTWENGYGWNAGYGLGKWVLKMTPLSYPYTINQVCFAMTRISTGSANWTFDIVMYDATGTGGAPGTLLGTIANQTAVNVPLWPTVSWFDFTGITTLPQVASGSFYLGISYDPATMPSHYIGADESATTTMRTGYGYIQSAWAPIQTYFPTYKCIGVRCDGEGITYAHNIAVGPFLGLPSLYNVGVSKTIKAKISNLGTSNETGIPIKFLVNGTQLNATTLNLNSGAVDSVPFTWTPVDTGNFNLRIVSALANDEYRANDTVLANVQVYPSGIYSVCTGNDTISISYPFSTSFMDSRTDMLCTASDIGTGPAYFYKIGFFIISTSPQVMNGFKVKMQNTTITSISGFTSTGWTEVFAQNWAVPGIGLQFITLTTPFVYIGANLLIEICYNNSSSSSNSLIRSTVKAGRVYHNQLNLPSGDGCVDITTGSIQSTLPNICFMSPGGVKKIQNEIPDRFSLSQNYPNPFNPKTIIHYSIPPSRGARGVTDVKLTIFDAVGKAIVVLVNEKQGAGNYSVEWDGTNYSSGLYFYKLECDGFSDVKKMVLIK